MPDATVGYISRRVHGPLMLALAKSVGYHDLDVVNLFRDGAPLLGELQRRLACNLDAEVRSRYCFAGPVLARKCRMMPHLRENCTNSARAPTWSLSGVLRRQNMPTPCSIAASRIRRWAGWTQ